jgi:hypothetical protein
LRIFLQTRVRTLDGMLRDLFTTWYLALAINDIAAFAAAGSAPTVLHASLALRPSRIGTLAQRFEKPGERNHDNLANQELPIKNSHTLPQ